MPRAIQWGPQYVTGVRSMDEQHFELSKITNELVEACGNSLQEADASFRGVIKRSSEYVAVHFKSEEQLMAQSGYPLYRDHKSEHEGFVKRILESARDYSAGKKGAANAFADYLREWLWDHIAVSDRQFAEHYLRWAAAGKPRPPAPG